MAVSGNALPVLAVKFRVRDRYRDSKLYKPWGRTELSLVRTCVAVSGNALPVRVVKITQRKTHKKRGWSAVPIAQW